MITYALILIVKRLAKSIKNMGLFDFIYSTGGKLEAVPEPIGVHPQMCKSQLTTLVLKESLFSISGDDFSITDATTQQPVLKCSGSMLSLHDRKSQLLALSSPWSATSTTARRALRSTSAVALAATFISIGGERKTLHLDGDMWGRTAKLKLDDGTSLGHIARELVNVTDFAADKQTYCLTVAPNVDISLMAAICVCFDEIKNDADDDEEKKKDDD
ncbi:hypothetical protein A1Q2_01181 [Trichosporon asahii var. asahii CBS 8904]|uniref:Uncharacterized protein n=2 Tax=Trichosporon asahii var. asahii TaxID=189963 RepID=K1VK38_TRIAC|nr:hypothetical protein A1Q1_04957 [Trichosporon asahii var. asahii CBS 2479]EJT46468.1 hypothetical protein A1Q1_04957 [Trichosporon asahii var. asahii CBS 2479]EKD04530.1 hypothetical protein A1Q2_01181 [Trichosporon asahii var. asahii CBS 8904]